MEYKDVTDVIGGLHGILDKIESKIKRSWVMRVHWYAVNVAWWAPPVYVSTEWELDWPYRKGKTLFLRYSFRRSAVLGFWGKKGYDEDTALLEATIYGRERTDDERRAWDESRLFLAEDASLELLQAQPGLRVRATVDAGVDVG